MTTTDDATTANYPTVQIPAGAGVLWPLTLPIPAGWERNRQRGDSNGFCYIMSSTDEPIQEVDLDNPTINSLPFTTDDLVSFLEYLDTNKEVVKWADNDKSHEDVANEYLASLTEE